MLAARRLSELQELHETKLRLLAELQRLQDLLGNEDHILSSHPHMLLTDQLQDLKSEIQHYHAQIDHLQTERDDAFRRESELAIKAEAVDATKRGINLRETRIATLEMQLQEFMAERDASQLRLEEAHELSRGRDTVPELKVIITTLHKEMGMMQGQLDMYKDTARALCALRADMQSDASVLERKTHECNTLSDKVSNQLWELRCLKEQVKVLQESEQELKLILDMYESQCADSREVRELRHAECRAWGQVERLKAALDEHSLELRVKAANEAEAGCQQRLAVAESEIADLRQRLDASQRMALELNETLKAKNEEGDAYITEIETIGQAYEDMQMQNQRLLQQISERDEYNTKLVSDSVRAKQLQTTLVAEKRIAEGRSHHAVSVADSQKQIVLLLEEQVRTFSNQLNNAAEEAKKVTSSLDSVRRRTADMEKEASSAKSALKLVQKELKDQGSKLLEVQLELEREKFEKKRMQEELAALSRKTARLSSPNGGGTVVEKLQEEIKEYKAILNCGVCHDRPKEVVITKCYHLFCNPCIQRNLEMRHRKCPGCGVPFGQNDVRNVYI
ncbi:hypothetical protein O6H91_09G116100 [Diphasiastrum complanatum]|nr:hypothetical protein O6H91_09G116100 [Diphasiastrum complanatum]